MKWSINSQHSNDVAIFIHNTLSNDIIIRNDIVVLLFCINESNVKNDYTIFDESKFVYRNKSTWKLGKFSN